MSAENTQRILDKVDELLAAIGQKDYEQLRSILRSASLIFKAMAAWSAQGAALTREELIRAIDRASEDEQEQKLRMLEELQDLLPTFGTLLVEGAARVFPRAPGGRPPAFKDRDSARQACNLVLAFIAKGDTAAKAKERTARELGISKQSVNRIWKQRTIIGEQSMEEFLLQKIRSLSVNGAIPNLKEEPASGKGRE